MNSPFAYATITTTPTAITTKKSRIMGFYSQGSYVTIINAASAGIVKAARVGVVDLTGFGGIYSAGITASVDANTGWMWYEELE